MRCLMQSSFSRKGDRAFAFRGMDCKEFRRKDPTDVGGCHSIPMETPGSRGLPIDVEQKAGGKG